LRAIFICAWLICIFIRPIAIQAAESFSFTLELPDLTSNSDSSLQNVSASAESKLNVLVFLSPDCPASVSHEAYLKKLKTEFPSAQFTAIYSGSTNDLAGVRKHFKAAAMEFSALHDLRGDLKTKFRVLKTPTAVVLMGSQRVYFGGITNSHTPDRAEKHYLRAALEDLKDGRSVAIPQGRTLGCYIGS
jgi:hypothetical protein